MLNRLKLFFTIFDSRFEDLERHFAPAEHDLLIAVGPHRVNGLRAARYDAGRARGYGFTSYVASRASRSIQRVVEIS